MRVAGPLEKAKHYIETHPKLSDLPKEHKQKIAAGPCITISRETGAGADVISEKLAEFFQNIQVDETYQWAVFDKNLIEKVLQDHHLPQRLGKVLEEEKYNSVKSIMHELLGESPGTWTLVHKTTETILQLAHTGNVIILERGGNIITSKLHNAFNIRIVAPLENRIKHIQEIHNLDRRNSIDFIKKEEEDRKDYLMNYFHRNIEDPVLYHLVINSGQFSYDEVVQIIGNSVIKKFPKMFN